MLYFIEETGKWTKAIFPYEPYFFLLCAEEVTKEIIFYLNKKYEKTMSHVDVISKEDLELINHLSGKQQKYIKLSFKNTRDMQAVKMELQPLVK
jgi:DNA polymerase epsilon subunit 1